MEQVRDGEGVPLTEREAEAAQTTFANQELEDAFYGNKDEPVRDILDVGSSVRNQS